MTLTTKLITAAILCAAVLTGAVAAMAADERTSVSTPAGQIQFGPTGIKTDKGELWAGPAYGNLAEGKHGTFIRMPAGFVSPPHIHTEDYFGIVIAGVGANGPTTNDDLALPVGSYWFQRGGDSHVTKCLSDTDCLFFIYQPGKFDYLLAE